MKKLAVIAMLYSVLVGAQGAHATTFPTDWWSNQTASSEVNEFGPEGVRLWSARAGYIEGTVSLPQWGVWTISFRAHTDETFDLPAEYTRVYVNGALVEELFNTPPGTTFRFTHTISGAQFGYRFEFSSPTANFSSHMVMDAGSATVVSPDLSQAAPSSAEIWPPNNKMVEIAIEGVTDDDGVTITITGIADNEGSDPDDVAGVGSPTARVRAQRDGGGSGRVYTISFSAVDGGGAESRGSVEVTVPHDRGQRKGAGKAAGAQPASWADVKGSALLQH